jgi:hypothetical protein
MRFLFSNRDRRRPEVHIGENRVAGGQQRRLGDRHQRPVQVGRLLRRPGLAKVMMHLHARFRSAFVTSVDF